MKISLCLSGGGSRGAFHLGVLEYLDEIGIEIENLSGSSIGSIIASSYACGLKPKEILNIFNSKEIKKAIKFNYFNKGLFTLDLESSIVKELLPIENIEDLKKNLYICVYDIKSKEIIYLNKGCIKKACQASCALIPVFTPVNDDNNLYIDGGLKDSLPITPLLYFNNEILSVDLLPRKENFVIRRKLLKDWHDKIDFSISKSNYYITTKELQKYKILSFKNLDLGFELGYKTCKEYFENTL